LLQIEIEGLTGTIKFDGEGLRSHFTLNVVEVTIEGIQTVGTWNPTGGANFTRMWLGFNNRDGDSLFNKTLIVSSILVLFL
jgi:glutamate receptor, ionotropic, invertebrate